MAADEWDAGAERLDAPSPARRRLVVIGGGLVGAATAEAAARLSGGRARVDLYEAAAIGHAAGASIDVNRVLRHAHGDEAHYTRWSVEAVRRWRDLERRGEQALFQQSGMLWMVHAADQPFVHTGLERPLFGAGLAFVEASARTLRALGVSCELLDGAEVRRRYPLFVDPSLGTTLLDTEAGILRARDAVVTLAALARRQGVTVHEGARVVRVHPSAGACAVELADGSSVEADVVVLAVNGWTEELLPDINARIAPAGVDLAAEPTRGLHLSEQPVYHVVPRAEVFDQFLPERLPIVSFLNTRASIFPTTLGTLKLACDDGYRVIRSPQDRQVASPGYREELFAYLERQVPALRGAALVQERVCFYDRSPDDDFILDQWDPEARLLVACGFSGHGFKFGPLLGDRLARYALAGRRPDDLAPFSLARFAAPAAAH